MKTHPTCLALVSCFFLSLAHAAPEDWIGKKVPQLVLEDGQTYSEVTFKRIEPDAVTITHADGVARIDMEKLKPESREALGYNALRAHKARAAARVRAAKAREAAAIKRAEKIWKDSALKIVVDVLQVLDDGILANDMVVHPKDGIPYAVAETHFIGYETADYNVYDGMRLELWAVPLEVRVSYTTVLGAKKTVKSWSMVEK